MLCFNGTASIVKDRTYRDDNLSSGLPNRYPKPWLTTLRLGDIRGTYYMIDQDTVTCYPAGQATPSARVPNPGRSFWRFVSLNDRLYYFDNLDGVTAIDASGAAANARITGPLTDELPDLPFRLFWNNAADQLFVYLNRKLYWLRPEKDGSLTSTPILSGFDFEKARIAIVYYDVPNRQLLLGSDSKGLTVVKRKHFSVVQSKGPLPHDIYYAQVLLKDGTVLADYGKRFDSLGRYRATPAFSGIGRQFAYQYGADGNLWTLTADTLYCHTALGERLLMRVPNREPSQVLFRTDDGGFLVGGLHGGLYHWDIKAKSYITLARMSHAVTWIDRMDHETLWLGTAGGLYRYHTPTNTTYPVRGLEQSHIRSLHRDATDASRLWICTEQHGIVLYEDTATYHIPLDDAGFLRSVHCIMEDKNGYFWISTNKGMFHVKKQHLLQYREGETGKPHYFHYGIDDGFATNEFNGGCNPCAITLPDGRLSFPSLEGLVWFDPDEVSPEWPSGPLLIDGINLDGTTIQAHDTIRLPAAFSRLNLTVSTPYAGDSQNLLIEYSISGDRAGDNWLRLNPADQTLSINELPSGYHQINMRVRNGWGADSFIHRTLTVFVTPRFHETKAFLVLVFIGCLALGWLILWLRTRFILQQNELLSLKVAVNSAVMARQETLQQLFSASIVHDIRAPLNYVVMALKGIQAQLGYSTVANEVKLVYQASNQIFRYANNLSKLAKVMLNGEGLYFNVVRIRAVAQKQVDLFEPIAQSVGTQLVNEVAPDLEVHSHEEILSIILHNLLDNATKFTRQGHISVSAGTLGKDNYLRVSDTGMGMDPADVAFYNLESGIQPDEKPIRRGGLGLLLVRDVVKLIHGKLTITSTPGEGTVITIRFPQAYTGVPSQ